MIGTAFSAVKLAATRIVNHVSHATVWNEQPYSTVPVAGTGKGRRYKFELAMYLKCTYWLAYPQHHYPETGFMSPFLGVTKQANTRPAFLQPRRIMQAYSARKKVDARPDDDEIAQA